MLTVRRGESEDLPAIAAIQAASPEAAQWDVRDYLGYEFRVAAGPPGPQGFLVARRLDENECELLNLAVAPGSRRQGVGRALVNWLISAFPGAVLLEVRESNRNARDFYKQLGFQEIGCRSGYYRTPSESAIVMKFHSC
jgi:ribosomal-protein-alanine N-acetyltransferase